MQTKLEYSNNKCMLKYFWQNWSNKTFISILPSHTVASIYYPIIQPNIDYCLIGLSVQKGIGQLQKLQNRAAHVITANFNRTIIKNLGLLNITNRHQRLTGCLMHKCLHDNNFKSENCTLVSNYKLTQN